ncbi:MAG: ribonuclease H-like domain-containing protein [Actinobacteria bacterium]|nr:ribonuclease H-like domain-containing protein [Actinomycetota bacterium]MBU1944853.1 ribonuclease H-like domain-containing protein [Actinomycetota bacterium]MBU2687080.1 ribonuclease H-like domain-containing protein [Actinomycetota bacterium]
MSIYLDIETQWNGRITVLGFYHESTGLVQIYGEDVTCERMIAELPELAEYVFTYNGHCFDLRLIRDQLEIDMRRQYTSYDLRWICQRNGLTGGLKGVERTIGIERRLPDVDGLEAIRLWNRYRAGDRRALKKLLTYNEEDVMNLIRVREHLEALGVFEVGV